MCRTVCFGLHRLHAFCPTVVALHSEFIRLCAIYRRTHSHTHPSAEDQKQNRVVWPFRLYYLLVIFTMELLNEYNNTEARTHTHAPGQARPGQAKISFLLLNSCYCLFCVIRIMNMMSIMMDAFCIGNELTGIGMLARTTFRTTTHQTK